MAIVGGVIGAGNPFAQQLNGLSNAFGQQAALQNAFSQQNTQQALINEYERIKEQYQNYYQSQPVLSDRTYAYDYNKQALVEAKPLVKPMKTSNVTWLDKQIDSVRVRL